MKAVTTDTGGGGDAGGPTVTGSRVVRGLALASALAGVAAAVWIVVAALTAGRGFDTTDEGYYLLSYRWWSTNTRTFTGSQYLYGPVFQAFGYDIADLRLFRLVTVVVAQAVFGWSLMRWLRGQRRSAPATRLWEVTGAVAIAAAGGAVYGWLPLSPGYNDVSLLGGLLAMAVVLGAARRVDAGERVPAWLPAAFGPIVVATVLAKWTSSTITLGLVALVAWLVLGRRGWREVLRFAAWALASIAVTAALVHLLVVPLDTALPQMIAVNKLVAGQTNSPLTLLHMYWSTTVDLVWRIAKRHALLLLAAGIAVLWRNTVAQRCAAVLAVAGLAVAAWRVVVNDGAAGGTVHLTQYPVALLGTFVVVLFTGVLVIVRERTSGASLVGADRRTWAILAMIALLPVTQAMGTGNPIYMMAINGFAAWVAIMVVVVTGMESSPTVARVLTGTLTALAVLLASTVAVTGLWTYPYRTAGHDRATAAATGVPALDSVRLDPATAKQYSDLYHRLQPYLSPPGRAIMAFDEMAGVVLLLDGRPVGEAWYSASDHARSAAGITATCREGRDGKPWWGDRRPVLLFRRPISATEIDALGSCGLQFATDYRLLGTAEETMGFSVYVPVTDA